MSCEAGSNLRRVLLDNHVNLYNGVFAVANCHGLDTCGTCAVGVAGEVSDMEGKEKLRLSLPPHDLSKNRRLACQTKVLGNVAVTKYDGKWGQGDNPLWTPEAAAV